MWRMIRAALIGVVFGVVGGSIIGQVYYLRYFYNIVKEEGEEAINALVYNNDSSYIGLLDGMEIVDPEFDMEETQAVEEMVSMPEVIQFDVTYNGIGELTAAEITELRIFVKQAVLYALAEKLGEDYNQSMTKEEVRRNLILSLEYINGTAKESALEWGVDVNSWANFDYQYMQETEIDGILCPEGYYEVLHIYLAE